MFKLTQFAALALAVLLTPAAFAADDKKPDDKKAEKVDNPEYKLWSSFKAGSGVVLKMTNEFGGMTFDTTVTTKLLEVKDDKLVVEAEGVSKINGMEVKQPPTKRDVLKQLDKPAVGFDAKTGKPEGTVEEGKKKLKVGGTEYECKWYKTKNKVKLPTGEEEVEGEMWLSDEVPGGMLKMAMKMKAGTTSMEATEITIKK